MAEDQKKSNTWLYIIGAFIIAIAAWFAYKWFAPKPKTSTNKGSMPTPPVPVTTVPTFPAGTMSSQQVVSQIMQTDGTEMTTTPSNSPAVLTPAEEETPLQAVGGGKTILQVL